MRVGLPPDALDGSPGSLVGVWEWFVSATPTAVRAASRRTCPRGMSPDPPVQAGAAPPAAVRDADGLALYLALGFERALPGLTWADSWRSSGARGQSPLVLEAFHGRSVV